MTIFSGLVALGSMLGLVWILLDAPVSNRRVYSTVGISALGGALLGGRAAYVAVHWEYFQNHLVDIPQVWLGGLAWPGALAGGILATLIAILVSGLPIGLLLDRLLPLLAALSIAVWLGCWMVGCAYGPEAALGVPTKDEWGIWKSRLPLQLICALVSVALFWGIERLRQRGWVLIPGMAASLVLGGLALILLGASLLRADSYPLWNGLRLETWAALLFFGLAIISGSVLFFRDR